MPSSAAIFRIGLSLAAWAISMSEGTGRTSLSLVGTKGITAFLPSEDREAPAFLTRGFFDITFFLGKAFLIFDFVAIFAPSVGILPTLSKTSRILTIALFPSFLCIVSQGWPVN